MKRTNAIQISVPEPCTQAWEDMLPVQGGRHCAQCQKIVVDFTRMTDAQLLEHFTTKRVSCGQFTSDQLDRTIYPVEIQKSNWLARIAASILILLGLSKDADAQNIKSKEAIEQKSETYKAKNASDALTSLGLAIYGNVTDEKGNPVVQARVTVFRNGIMRGQDLTDFDGNYSIKPLDTGEYEIEVSHIQYSVFRQNVTLNNSAQKICTRLSNRLMNNREEQSSVIIRGGAWPIIDPIIIDPLKDQTNLKRPKPVRKR